MNTATTTIAPATIAIPQFNVADFAPTPEMRERLEAIKREQITNQRIKRIQRENQDFLFGAELFD